MDIISILGLVLGLAVLIMMGFKGWGMIPTSIVGALVVVITNRMDLWEALSTHYGTFMKNYAGDYFLMFFLGTLFGALMGSSGAAKSIACKIVDLMGSKRALLIVVITSAVLSYGGVSFAVVVFTLYPIALVLFKEGNVSKRLFPAALFAGCASFTMVGLPGSPQIQNIMPTEVLGTTAYAAPLNGIVVSCIIFALSMVWLEWNDKRLKAAGIGFVPGRKDDLEAIDISDRTGMLPFGLAVIPILFVVLYIFVMQQVLKDAVTWSTNYIVIQSLALGCLLAFALFHKRIHAFRDSVNDAATNSLIALMDTAVVTGFGGVVQGSHGFELVKEFALSLDMNPLISACVATAIVAAACGSCSGGLSVFLAALGPQYVQLCQAQGIDPQILHRSITWAGAGLDSLPHSGGYVTANIYTDQTPKETYPYFFVTNIGLTTLGCVLTVALYMLFGLV